VQDCCNINFDFSYSQDICNPFLVQFSSIGTGFVNPYWSFGDGSAITNTFNPTHAYASPGNYVVKFSVQNAGCIDTITKTISLIIIPDDIISTPDTTICINSTKQLRTRTALNFCWSPTTYLDDPLSPNPTTSAKQNITYYFTAQVVGTSVINNGNFNNGNSGFTSEYNYANPNITEGQYFVGTNPRTWNPSLSNCGDHTTGNGNMLLVNGAPTPDINVWKQTVNVTPNTNYAFSTWIQALWPPNPAQLSFSINGADIGTLITASLPTCTWTQFYTTWNSGSNTSATISIVNKNTFVQGNDFALDDISFAPVLVKKDSVKINVNTPFIKSTNDSTVCSGSKIQLNTSGALSYSWSPGTGLSNTSIPNPIATINNSITYFVAGTNNFGCVAKDTVNFIAVPNPVVSKSNDTSLCGSSPVQLFAGGGVSYSWTPASSLNNPNINNPIATPLVTTVYHVTVTNAVGCSKTDSVKITVGGLPVITKSNDTSVCGNTSVQLHAGGGSTYSWTPAFGLSDVDIGNPIATPLTTTKYYVTVTNAAGCSKMDSILITVKNSPVVTKSNDTSVCLNSNVQLLAGGGASYTWTPAGSLNNSNVNNPVATPLVTTIYHVVITNAAGCSKSDSVKITVNDLPVISKSNDTGVCNNASVQLFASGGNSYSWTPAATLNNANISNPVATPAATTTYYVKVTNAAGCSKSDSIKIITSAPPIITKSGDMSICKNTSTQLFAAGGSTYLWSPSATLNNAGIPNPVATPGAATTYYVIVTNAFGCAKTDSVKVGINPVAVIAKSNDTLICNNASVKIFAAGGSSYLWSPASSLDDPTSSSPLASPSTTTLYKVAIKDSYSCSYTDSVKVSVRSAAIFNVTPDGSTCVGSSKQLEASGGDSYTWAPASGLDNANISNPVANPIASTTYTVTIHENTCNETAVLTTNVTVLPSPEINASSSNDLTCSLGSSQLTVTGGTNYTWAPSTGLNNSNISNPVATPAGTTLYKVTGTGANGCSGSDTVTVKVNFNINALYLLPNSFTPNGDGLNDCFGVKYWGVVNDLDFSIYNRYGERIFHSTDPANCWDGTYKGKPQNANVFVYIVKAKTACGNVDRKGTVALLK
jgi:gliding motility-associated-like protein